MNPFYTPPSGDLVEHADGSQHASANDTTTHQRLPVVGTQNLAASLGDGLEDPYDYSQRTADPLNPDLSLDFLIDTDIYDDTLPLFPEPLPPHDGGHTGVDDDPARGCLSRAHTNSNPQQAAEMELLDEHNHGILSDNQAPGAYGTGLPQTSYDDQHIPYASYDPYSPFHVPGRPAFPYPFFAQGPGPLHQMRDCTSWGVRSLLEPGPSSCIDPRSVFLDSPSTEDGEPDPIEKYLVNHDNCPTSQNSPEPAIVPTADRSNSDTIPQAANEPAHLQSPYEPTTLDSEDSVYISTAPPLASSPESTTYHTRSPSSESSSLPSRDTPSTFESERTHSPSHTPHPKKRAGNRKGSSTRRKKPTRHPKSKPDVNPESGSSSCDRLFLCDYEANGRFCGKYFARRYDLNRHRDSIHWGEKKGFCLGCTKKYARKDGLVRHHNQEGKAECVRLHFQRKAILERSAEDARQEVMDSFFNSPDTVDPSASLSPSPLPSSHSPSPPSSRSRTRRSTSDSSLSRPLSYTVCDQSSLSSPGAGSSARSTRSTRSARPTRFYDEEPDENDEDDEDESME